MNHNPNQEFDYQIFNSLIRKNICFALFSLPGEKELQLVLQKSADAHIFENLTELNQQKGFVIAPFSMHNSSPIVLIKPDIYIKGEQQIFDFVNNLSQLTYKNNETKTKSEDNSEDNSETFDKYKEKFNLFLSEIENKNFQKLVLSRTYTYSQKEDLSIGDLFKKANNKYSSNFVYICHTPQTGCWIGSSPELLLSGESHNWQTVALAGTQKISEEKKYWDEKNKYEQQIVTDYMEQQLQLGKYQYIKKEPYTIQSGNLKHIKTEFIFEIENPNKIGTLLELLHPSPAICGYPKKEAFEFIQQNEGYDRKYYSGFLGCLNLENKTNLYVNLRCMKIEKTTAILYAGGGILPSSSLDSEWQETENKLQTMLTILNN